MVEGCIAFWMNGDLTSGSVMIQAIQPGEEEDHWHPLVDTTGNLTFPIYRENNYTNQTFLRQISESMFRKNKEQIIESKNIYIKKQMSWLFKHKPHPLDTINILDMVHAGPFST
jgi:hypothetical protein